MTETKIPYRIGYTDAEAPPDEREWCSEIGKQLREIQPSHFSFVSPAVYTRNVRAIHNRLAIVQASARKYAVAVVELSDDTSDIFSTGTIITKPIDRRDCVNAAKLIQQWAKMVEKWDARQAANSEGRA